MGHYIENTDQDNGKSVSDGKKNRLSQQRVGRKKMYNCLLDGGH